MTAGIVDCIYTRMQADNVARGRFDLYGRNTTATLFLHGATSQSLIRPD